MELPGRWRVPAAKSGAALLCWRCQGRRPRTTRAGRCAPGPRLGPSSGGNAVIRGLLGQPGGRALRGPARADVRPPAGGARERRADLQARARDARRVQVRPGHRAPDADGARHRAGPDRRRLDLQERRVPRVVGRAAPASAAASSPSTSPTRRTRSSSRSCPRCPTPTTARARTRSRSTRRTSRATCWRSTTSRAATDGVGGFDLYDVSDPAEPEAARAGRRRPVAGPRAGRGQGPDHAGPGRRSPTAPHSIFIWQDGAEGVRGDRRQHRVLRRRHLRHHRPGEPGVHHRPRPGRAGVRPGRRHRRRSEDASAIGGSIFLHDMVVKRINGRRSCSRPTGTSGYIKLNVSDPANPVIVGDSAFGERGPADGHPAAPTSGWRPPRATPTRREFSHDNKYVLAADEDFSQYRCSARSTRARASSSASSRAARRTQARRSPTARAIDGDSRFVGDGCVAADIPLATRASPSPSIERGGCDFQVKVQNAESRGYDGVIIFNADRVAGLRRRCST